MEFIPQPDLVGRRYREVFGASVRAGYTDWMACRQAATLGYRRADGNPLFLEGYLDEPIEAIASRVFGRRIRRNSIVEIGNFAADSALAMVDLWGSAANDLGSASEIAAATLTMPLRRMFRRIGLPIIAVAKATPDRLGREALQWGSYYALDPVVCLGEIASGQAAIASFMARRPGRKAA